MAILSGMKEICGFLNKSEATVLDLIRNRDFPAMKLGGCWESDTDLIVAWRLQQIKDRTSAGRDNRQVDATG